jgi:hypothetical protein
LLMWSTVATSAAMRRGFVSGSTCMASPIWLHRDRVQIVTHMAWAVRDAEQNAVAVQDCISKISAFYQVFSPPGRYITCEPDGGPWGCRRLKHHTPHARGACRATTALPEATDRRKDHEDEDTHQGRGCLHEPQRDAGAAAGALAPGRALRKPYHHSGLWHAIFSATRQSSQKAALMSLPPSHLWYKAARRLA